MSTSEIAHHRHVEGLYAAHNGWLQGWLRRKMGGSPDVLEWRGIRLGVLICEEVWDAALATGIAQQGAELLLVPRTWPTLRRTRSCAC